MVHKFYFTNNLGGGGTNVSRLVDYKQLLDLPNIGLLLNYYYLTGQSVPKFDAYVIDKIRRYASIGDFLNGARKMFAARRRTSAYFVKSAGDSKMSGYMLDNGCGNILRDLLRSGRYNADSIKKIIKPFLDFSESMQFDYSIALDLAMKYTYKSKETIDEKLTDLWTQLSQNEAENLALIEATLDVMRENSYSRGIYAPLHGFNYESFCDYVNMVKKLEDEKGVSFTGLALGGIADARKLENELWGVPKNIRQDLKTGYIVSKLCEAVKKIDNRPLHVLGAGNIFVLPFIVHAGASSSDCHSAWRRSSDGGYEKAKVLIPLLNSDLDFINSENCLQYVRICDLDERYHFESEIPITDLKKLFLSHNKEDFYFAEIFTFVLAIRQYDLLIRYMENNPNDYLEKLCHTPDCDFNVKYLTLISVLNL